MAGINITLGGNFAALNQLQAKVAETMTKIRTGFSERIGHRLLDSLAGSLRQLPAHAKEAIDAASDLSETVSKVGEVFQDQAEAILAWSNNSAKGFGQSRAEAMAAAADFGNLFRAMGLTTEQGGAMSRRLVELAADLASFNNTEVPDAIQAIGAALRGESEPMRRYGVLLDDATLKAEALSRGLYNGTGTLAPASRALAAYEVILRQTATAQGDFARTSEGLANSQRIVAAEMKNAQAAAGEALLPTVERIVNALAKVDGEALGEQFGSWANEAGKHVRGLMGLLEDLANMPEMKVLTMGWSGAVAKGWRSVADVGVISTQQRASNAALQEFAPQRVAEQVATQEEIAEILGRLESTKRELDAQMTAAMEGQSVEVQEAIRTELEVTIRTLDLYADRIRKIPPAVLEANRAAREATAAEAEHAAAIEKSRKAYEKARETYEKTLDAAEKRRVQSLPLEEQARELARAEARLRETFNEAIRTNFAQGSGREIAESLQRRIDREGIAPGLEKDLATATKLMELEERRAEIAERLRKEQEEAEATKREALATYADDINLLAAELEGNQEKLRQLKEELAIRQKAAELIRAGVEATEAHRRAEALVATQSAITRQRALEGAEEVLAEAEALASGREADYRRSRRARELEEQGLTTEEASNAARAEQALERLRELQRQQQGTPEYESSIQADSMQRIGGGGGVYAAGLDYSRRQTDHLREIEATLKEIRELTPRRTIEG